MKCFPAARRIWKRPGFVALGMAALMQTALAQTGASPPPSSGLDGSAAHPAVRIQDDAICEVNGDRPCG